MISKPMLMKAVLPSTLRVLFVDDDSDEYYLFNEALEQSALSVNMIAAKDGLQLLNYLNTQEHPDIIFLDLNMPYKDGIETLVEIKENTAFKDIPVIIFSTSRNIHHINDCYKNGASLYLVKPETFEDIVKMVKRVFAIDWKAGFQARTPEDFVWRF